MQTFTNFASALARRFWAWDRNVWMSLLWRLAVVFLIFQPWAFRFESVDFTPQSLDPSILEAAQKAGINPFDPKTWQTFPEVVARMMGLACVWALLWWGVSRLRRRLSRRQGLGFWAAMVPLGAFVALQFGLMFIRRVGIASPDHFSDAIPVWQGWVRHPLMWSDALAGALGFLNFFGILLGEWLIQLWEGRSLLKEAQAGALRARLSPHFLYNVLNTLSAQIPTDPDGAQETTQRLSGLFEQVSKATVEPSVSLSRELAFVEDYLALERKRLGDRLKVEVDIPEELLNVSIPVLALQVLVENALKHAIAPRAEGGQLRIRAFAEGANAWISVWDSGNGESRSQEGTGQALANLRMRLEDPSNLELIKDRGFEARFRVPLMGVEVAHA